MRGLSISRKQAVRIEGASPAPKRQPPSRASLATVAFEIGSRLVGGGFTEEFKEMQRAQWLTADELQARSNARLSALLRHAAENVPFYREEYQRLGLVLNELRTVNDLTRLPVLGKADYRKRQPQQFYATNIPAYRRLEKTTSGSTGEPFQFCLDRAALPSVFASHLFYDSWHGLSPFDRYVRIAATPPTPPSLPVQTPAAKRLRQAITDSLRGIHERWTQERISVWEVDGERALEIWRRIEAFRPRFVMGYTSSLATIADELLRRNLPLSRPVSAVVTIAETLSPTRRRLIEEYFRAPIINRYGLREFGSWSAQSCAESPDRFHINTELVVCEILRADGSRCAPGETGRVVLTDLRNYARPFIRYETGDLAVARAEKCDCGRGFPLLTEIQGRSQESLRTPSGKEISPVVLGHYLFVYHDHLKVVRHYQLVRESSTKLTLLVVSDEGWNEEHRGRLRSDLARLVGDDMEVAVQTVDEIPKEQSGKRPIIKLR
jgi:phenylacetate-CoA ligase